MGLESRVVEAQLGEGVAGHHVILIASSRPRLDHFHASTRHPPRKPAGKASGAGRAKAGRARERKGVHEGRFACTILAIQEGRMPRSANMIGGVFRLRAAQITLAIVLALVALESLYLVVGNAIIRTDLLRSWINDGPDRTHVEYGSAYTLWPGRVHVTGLRIWDRDDAAEWRISLDEGVGRIGLWELLGRRFHTSHLRGTGLVLRIRSRLPAAQATPRELSLLPEIPELPEPPVRAPGRKDTEPPSSEVWSVFLDTVAVEDVREIWVDTYHFTGRSRLTGALYLVPHQTLEVPKTVLDVEDGAMQYRGLPAAAALHGRVETAVRECSLPGLSGGDVLKFMTGLGRVEGRIDDTQVLDEIVGLAPHVRFRKGRGTALAELSLDQGRGTGHLDFAIEGIQALTEGLRLDGHADGSMRLSALDLMEGHADFDGSRLRMRNVVVTKDNGQSRPWWMSLDIGSGRLGTDVPRVFRSRITATARDARPLYRLLNTGLPHWAEGILELDSMSARADVTIGESFIEADSLVAEGDDYRIEGRYRRRGTSSNGLFLVSRGHLDVAAAIVEGKTDLKLLRAEKWYREHAATAF